MGKTYRPWGADQSWLLPPSPRDWLPEDDLVYFVPDTARELDISAITRKYEQEEGGFPPYHPRMMVALLLYSYLNKAREQLVSEEQAQVKAGVFSLPVRGRQSPRVSGRELDGESDPRGSGHLASSGLACAVCS